MAQTSLLDLVLAALSKLPRFDAAHLHDYRDTGAAEIRFHHGDVGVERELCIGLTGEGELYATVDDGGPELPRVLASPTIPAVVNAYVALFELWDV